MITSNADIGVNNRTLSVLLYFSFHAVGFLSHRIQIHYTFHVASLVPRKASRAYYFHVETPPPILPAGQSHGVGVGFLPAMASSQVSRPLRR